MKQRKISYNITFRYSDGTFKRVPYSFKSQEAFDSWLVKMKKDESKRKIEKEEKIT